MKKKLITLLILCLIFGMFYTFDAFRASQFHIGLVSVSPDPGVADGQSPITIVVQLTQNGGQPVGGHSLFAFSLGGGMLKANREITDENGKVTYVYYPYRASKLMELKDVPIKVIDESNSIVIEVNATGIFTVRLTEPEPADNGTPGQDDIFGEG